MKKRTRIDSRGGAALIIALWTIALLSLLVMSFALDALLEGKINVYVKQRRHVDYLTQSGIAIAEVILLDYRNATPKSGGTTTSTGRGTTDTSGAAVAVGIDDDTTDKWLQPKLDLQHGACSVKSYPIDPENPDSGTVSLEISSADVDKWPINAMIKSELSDKIWENILNVIGLPMEYQEEIVDSFYDWLDEDSTVTGRNGAESDYYDSLDVTRALGGRRLKLPRNGPLLAVAELEMIRGIRNQPAIYRGGVLESDKSSRFKQDEVTIRMGLKEFFTIYGDKPVINVNSATVELLMTVPGIDGDQILAGALVEERSSGANMRTAVVEGDAESLLFKDWNDLNNRLPGGIPAEAEQFLVFTPQKYFEIKVTGESGGISHEIKTVAIVENAKVRYLRWREDP